MVRPGRAPKYDVVVVGAGNAALTAALSARQKGASVLVLEKAPQAERGGNSRFSGGIFRFVYDGIEDLKPMRPDLSSDDWDRVDVGSYGPERYLADLMRVTEGQANPELTKTMIQESQPTVMWMTELGVVWDWSIVWSTKTGESRASIRAPRYRPKTREWGWCITFSPRPSERVSISPTRPRWWGSFRTTMDMSPESSENAKRHRRCGGRSGSAGLWRL